MDDVQQSIKAVTADITSATEFETIKSKFMVSQTFILKLKYIC